MITKFNKFKENINNNPFGNNPFGNNPNKVTESNKPNLKNTDLVELTTSTLPIINVGMYHGELNPDYIIYIDEESEYTEDEYWENWDNEKYNNFILKSAREFIKENVTPYFRKLNLGVKTIKVERIYSPKQYNYGDDQLYFTLAVRKEKFIENILKKLNSDDENYSEENMDEWLSEEYKSRPGFISYMPQRKKDLIGCLDVKDDDYERGIAAFLTYVITEVDNKENFWQEEFVDFVRKKIGSEIIPEDFLSDHYWENINNED